MQVVLGKAEKQSGVVALMVSLGSQTIRSLRYCDNLSIQNDTVLLTKLSEIPNLLAKSPISKFSFSFIRVMRIWSHTGIFTFVCAKGFMQFTSVQKHLVVSPVYNFESVSVFISLSVILVVVSSDTFRVNEYSWPSRAGLTH